MLILDDRSGEPNFAARNAVIAAAKAVGKTLLVECPDGIVVRCLIQDYAWQWLLLPLVPAPAAPGKLLAIAVDKAAPQQVMRLGAFN